MMRVATGPGFAPLVDFLREWRQVELENSAAVGGDAVGAGRGQVLMELLGMIENAPRIYETMRAEKSHEEQFFTQ